MSDDDDGEEAGRNERRGGQAKAEMGRRSSLALGESTESKMRNREISVSTRETL